MADIARLGFSADTGDLKNAKAALDALVPSAANAEKATEKFNRAAAGVTSSAGGAASGIKSFQSAAMGASAGTTALSKAALASGTAMGTVERAAVGASAQMGNLVATTARVGMTFAQADAHVIAYRNSLNSVVPAAQGAKSALDRLGASANDNINRLQSTPGNIAAQFQDIGVTAAGGMSPLLIALQQGTQLSSAMAGGMKDVIAGFRQLFSVTAILSVALVGLVAYLIQLAMEFFTTSKQANTLSDAIDSVQSTSYALSDAQGILGNVIDLTTGKINTQTSALISLARAQLAAGRIKAINDQAEARSQLTAIRKGSIQLQGGMGGGLWVSRVGDGTEDVVTRFAQGVNTADQALAQLDNRVRNGTITEKAFLRAADAITKFGVAVENEKVFEDAQRLLNGDMSGNSYLLKPETARVARAARGRSGGKSDAEKEAEAYADLVKGAQARVESLRVESAALDMSARAGNLYRNEQELIAQALDKGITLTADQTKELKDLAARMTEVGSSVAFKDMLADIEKQMRALRNEASVIGLVGFELERATILQELMNKAVDEGIIDLNNMTEAMRLQVAMLENRATALAQQSDSNKTLKFVTDLTKAHEDEMWALGRERAELGLTGAALEAYRMETDLLNDAKRQNIALTPEILAQIRQQSDEYGIATEQIRKQREAIEFQRDTFKGFFTDMLSGLRQGQTVWEAFGNTVMNVVNRIIDRLLDQQLEGLLDSILNLAGTVAGASSGGGGKGANTTGGIKSISKNALGNAFDANGITAFAKGGAFTNGLYSSPTLFKFAKGGALGVMGEAGPEAVMPLKRGPDGSLGVQVHGAQQQSVRVQVDVNDDRFNAYVDDRANGVVVSTAPSIASAGADVAQNRTAFTNSRRLR